MNFLAHSLISLEIDEKENKKTLYANFAGDFYKGLVETIELPDELKEGIVLHRIIDKISDRNENFLNELLTEKFGIFKGIVSDMYIDHFLSKNFDSLFNDNLNNIENKILYNIKINEKFFPDNQLQKNFPMVQIWKSNVKLSKHQFSGKSILRNFPKS